MPIDRVDDPRVFGECLTSRVLEDLRSLELLSGEPRNRVNLVGPDDLPRPLEVVAERRSRIALRRPMSPDAIRWANGNVRVDERAAANTARTQNSDLIAQWSEVIEPPKVEEPRHRHEPRESFHVVRMSPDPEWFIVVLEILADICRRSAKLSARRRNLVAEPPLAPLKNAHHIPVLAGLAPVPIHEKPRKRAGGHPPHEPRAHHHSCELVLIARVHFLPSNLGSIRYDSRSWSIRLIEPCRVSRLKVPTPKSRAIVQHPSPNSP